MANAGKKMDENWFRTVELIDPDLLGDDPQAHSNACGERVGCCRGRYALPPPTVSKQQVVDKISIDSICESSHFCKQFHAAP